MPKTAFLFPGQGSQYVGMAQQLCDTLPAARKLFDEAAGILGYDLLDACAKGPKEQLDRTAVSQPAIFVASLAALESLRAQQTTAEADCIATAGLSLGEYTALAFARSLSFADGLRLVKTRGEAMQAAADATPSGMMSVLGLALDKVQELCVKASSFDANAIGDLYFLWTLERVGVIYSKERIAGKNWYDWGYPIVMAAQQPDGSWNESHRYTFGPLIDTPFALLFLKRANIARDLTEMIRPRAGN